jgi:TRAP-type C4-dicarboxylate transport system permease small subunit
VPSHPIAGPGADFSTRVNTIVRHGLGVIAASVLFFMMMLTVFDVAGRFFLAKPIPGSFELMEFGLAIVIFSALPLVTWDRGHITVSRLEKYFRGTSAYLQRLFVSGGSALVMGIVSWRLWIQGDRLVASSSITGFLEWPIAPISYAMSIFSGLSFVILLGLLWLILFGKALPVYDDGPSEQ